MDYRERWELKDYLVGKLLQRRIRLFHAGLFLLLLGFVLNFWYLQGVLGDEYSHLAENNRLRRIPLLPTRGVIFDRHDAVIASTRPALSLMLRRESARDLHTQLRWIAPIIGRPYELLEQRLSDMRGRPLFEPVVLKEDISLEELAQIEARRERFPSVEVQESARRYYPQGETFAHALGFVGEVSFAELSKERDEGSLHSGDIVGKSGIERTYDEMVRGSRGWELVSVNNLGRRMGDSRIGLEPMHGEHLHSSLDLRLQQKLTDGLAGQTGAGVFLDPWTGEVLALVSAPAFDPNLFADGISQNDWNAIAEHEERPMLDRAIASFHPPGSTFKIVLATAGLEAGVVGVDNTVVCNGFATHYNRRRLCWKRGGHGVVNLHKALAQSCNVYFYQLGRDLGIDRISEYGLRFGLGAPTGIDVPGEVPGVLPSREWKQQVFREIWYPGDTISVAIGQGLLSTTPLQMATVVSVVATGGWIPTPYIYETNAREPRKAELSSGSLRIVRAALADAVKHGTGGQARVEGVAVAGKTGTAQIHSNSAGVDSDELPREERDHGWFVGYAPADQPQIAFAVIVEHAGHGGSSAAPIVREVLEVFFSEQPVDDNLRAGIAQEGEADVGTPTAR